MMKKIILILLISTPFLGFTQKKKDIQKTNFEVNGVCKMCKARIEKTAFKIKGVKSVSWDITSHQLSLIYDASKTSLIAIQEGIAVSGHDTGLSKATDKAYNDLPMCCRYRDGDEGKKTHPPTKNH